MGPAHIIESSSTTGHIDADYRSRYGVGENKTVKEDLEQYSKRAYAAKTLTHIEHGDGTDFSNPFILRLDMANAGRGSSGINDAAVAIPPAGVLNRLPGWFSTDPDADNTKLTPEQELDRKKKVQARSSEYLVHPFVTEWHYRILLPEGFSTCPAARITWYTSRSVIFVFSFTKFVKYVSEADFTTFRAHTR